MKKIFYIIVAIAFAFGFTSCVVKDNPINKNEGVIMEVNTVTNNGPTWDIVITSKKGASIIEALDNYKGQYCSLEGDDRVTIKGSADISLEEFQYIQEKMPKLVKVYFDGYSGKIPGGAFYGNKKIKEVVFKESSKPYIIESGKNIMPAFGNINSKFYLRIYNAEVRTDFSKVVGIGSMLSGDWVVSEKIGECIINGESCYKFYNETELKKAFKFVNWK